MIEGTNQFRQVSPDQGRLCALGRANRITPDNRAEDRGHNVKSSKPASKGIHEKVLLLHGRMYPSLINLRKELNCYDMTSEKRTGGQIVNTEY